MSAPVSSRREAVRGAALAAGALAAAGLLRPGAALAQSTDDDDLRDFLATAIAIEQVAVLAYSTAADAPGTDPTLKGTFETFRDQEQAHASALKSALESIGFDAPDAPSSPTDTGVLDDVDGLDDDEATKLQDLLGKLDGIKGEAALQLLADLERRAAAPLRARRPRPRQRGPVDDRGRDRGLSGPASRRRWRAARRLPGSRGEGGGRRRRRDARRQRRRHGRLRQRRRLGLRLLRLRLGRLRAALRLRNPRPMADELEPRTASSSRSELIRWMGIEDANTAGFVHGGTVLRICDEAAAIAAIRHCRRRIVTAGVDRMTFVEPVLVGELLTCSATVNAAWHSSMEIGVRVMAENARTGARRHTSTAYVTMVALDDDGRPTPVPPLLAESDDERRRQREAELRRANRLSERDQILGERETG